MPVETRQKILDAALKLFAENGYKSAATRAIAKEAGVSEMTLFRKFETKKNLFDEVVSQNNEKMMKEFGFVTKEKKFENPGDFLETLIENLMKLGEDNFEIIQIANMEADRISENFVEGFVNNLRGYVKKNVCNDKINYEMFVFDILSFIYVFLLDQKRTFNREEAMEGFINNMTLCIQS